MNSGNIVHTKQINLCKEEPKVKLRSDSYTRRFSPSVQSDVFKSQGWHDRAQMAKAEAE